ncbi:MAG: DUF4346 domain-containing protein [Candidatus Woesearchaeota archaeon]
MKLKEIKYPEKIRFVEVKKYSKFKIDKKSFLLIRIKNKKIEVGICNYGYELVRAYRGTNIMSLYKKIIDDSWINDMKHAAYLGMELQKAEHSMKTGKKYMQGAA